MTNLTKKELLTLRRLIADEINGVRPWAILPDEQNAVEKLHELEHLLALVDGEIQNITFVKKAQAE